jgi:sulfur carrier protein
MNPRAAIAITVCVNGVEERLATATIAGLMAARALASNARGVAVALNGRVVPRAAWAETSLRDGDRVEIVRAMQGG